MNNLSGAEAGILRRYLGTLTVLECAVPRAGDNLDTDQAAVWTRNRDELRDRTKLFDDWRRRLCGFLGVPPGPDLADVASHWLSRVIWRWTPRICRTVSTGASMPPHAPSASKPMSTGRPVYRSHWIPGTVSCVCVLPSRHRMADLPNRTGMATRCGTAYSMPPIQSPATTWCSNRSTWFVASQQRLLPVLCVQTNRVVSFWRPAAPANTGVNNYGGVTAETNTPLLIELAGKPARRVGRRTSGQRSAERQFDPLLDRAVAGIPRHTSATIGSHDG